MIMKDAEKLVDAIYEKLKFEIDYDDIVEFNYRTVSAILKLIDDYKGIEKSMKEHVKEFRERTRKMADDIRRRRGK